MSNKILIGIFIVAILGFADTSYLSAKQYILGDAVPCAIVGGCETVLNSAYSKIGPVPLAFFGLAYYLALIILTAIYWEFRLERTHKLISILTVLGFISSLGLLGIQAFVLNAYCLYCLVSFATSTALFLLVHKHRFKRRSVV